MTVLLDRREQLGSQPSLHAFLVGVSNYRFLPKKEFQLEQHHLGMLRLNATSLAAFRVADWLVSHQDHLTLPLSTCRLLVSPTEGERRYIKSKTNQKLTGATLTHFNEYVQRWRNDALTNPKNMTLFYFAGHGVQRRSQDHVMLLQDFAADPD